MDSIEIQLLIKEFNVRRPFSNTFELLNCVVLRIEPDPGFGRKVFKSYFIRKDSSPPTLSVCKTLSF